MNWVLRTPGTRLQYSSLTWCKSASNETGHRTCCWEVELIDAWHTHKAIKMTWVQCDAEGTGRGRLITWGDEREEMHKEDEIRAERRKSICRPDRFVWICLCDGAADCRYCFIIFSMGQLRMGWFLGHSDVTVLLYSSLCSCFLL